MSPFSRTPFSRTHAWQAAKARFCSSVEPSDSSALTGTVGGRFRRPGSVQPPGDWEASLGGFPAISVLPGQFLLKDVALLGAAVFSAGEAPEAARRRRTVATAAMGDALS
jgi:hypothetical protein